MAPINVTVGQYNLNLIEIELIYFVDDGDSGASRLRNAFPASFDNNNEPSVRSLALRLFLVSPSLVCSLEPAIM